MAGKKKCLRMMAALLAWPCAAATYVLDDPASPVGVVFDSAGGKLTVTNKADGMVWRNPDSGGGAILNISGVTQTDTLHLAANATVAGAAISLRLELAPSNGELRVTIAGTNASLPGGVIYPWPFFPTNGEGFAVAPLDGGYVVPTTATNFSAPGGQHGMEWFGGTDTNLGAAWLAIVDTPDDYELKVRTGTIAGGARLGTAPNWRGSNANPGRQPNLLSYERRVRYRFLAEGGYVGMAKQFRREAAARGWLKTLAQKQQESPGLDLSRFIGAPVCYLWGDGRSAALLDAMTNAGIDKALIQVSVNHSDHQKKFPAAGLTNDAWFSAVRAHGFLGGYYDIYASVRTNGVGGSTFDGFYYRWPAEAATQWVIFQTNGVPDTRGTVSCQMAAPFAATNRLPAHLATFNHDAAFFDVVCAVDLAEDYDTNFNHFATRAIDRTNRIALLSTAYSNGTKRLLTGTEQGRSWAVPVLHWTEGRLWLGAAGSSFADGSWNDNSYPEIMTDVVDPTNTLSNLLSDGWQAPLWDLVFHDCLVSTVHWHRPHNKFLYGWDHADRVAILRGQAPLLNLTFAGAAGLATRTPNLLTNAAGVVWSTRWTVMSNRFVQTFTNVCRWHEKVGMREMTRHAWLTADRSVQLSEFSDDGGLSGDGVVVHFGTYDGAGGITGTVWTGTVRGQAVTVSPGDTQRYGWSNAPPRLEWSVTGATPAIAFDAPPGTQFMSQRSGDLANWTDAVLMQNAAATNRWIVWPGAGALPREIYRLRAP